MLEELEKAVQGKTLIIDSSAVTPYENMPLSQLLFHNLGSLNNDLLEMLARRKERMDEIIRLISSADTIIINEVITELTRHLTILNQQYSGKLRPPKNAFHKKHSKRLGKVEIEDLELLREHNEKLQRTIRGLANRDKRDHFSQEQQDTYKVFADLTNRYSKDLQRNDMRRWGRRNLNLMLEEPMFTDQKIIATAFTIAYERPVVIATGDFGIKKLGERISKKIYIGTTNGSPRYEVYLFITDPEKDPSKELITIFDPKINGLNPRSPQFLLQKRRK